MLTIMGCLLTKDPDPNEMYGHVKTSPPASNPVSKDKPVDHSETVKSNGEPVGLPTENHNGNCVKDQKNQKNKTLRGDLLLRSDARVERGRKIRDKQKQRELRAQEMSERVMDEKEMLSLISSRSRATSRTASPSQRYGMNNRVHPGSETGNTETSSPTNSSPVPDVPKSTSADSTVHNDQESHKTPQNSVPKPEEATDTGQQSPSTS